MFNLRCDQVRFIPLELIFQQNDFQLKITTFAARKTKHFEER